MARRPKPWWRKESNCYYVMIRGAQHRLDPYKKTADKLFYELMAAPVEEPNKPDVLLVFDVIKEVLEWVKKNRSQGTYEAYKQRCQWFIDEIGELPMSELSPPVVEKWVNKPTWSDGMRWTCIGTLKTIFRRAKRLTLIDESPLADMERPGHGKREHYITQEEYEKVMSLVTDQAFRDIISVVWECGCRPQEILRVTASEVDQKHARWIFPVKKSKGKKTMRVVNLTANSLAICERLCKQFPSGPIFRNSKGEPWTPDAVNCCFVRLQERMGKESGITIPEPEIEKKIKTLLPTKSVGGIEVKKSAAELRCEAKAKLTNALARKNTRKLCLYLFRHAWMTRMLLAGNDPITVAAMGGHSDPSMLAKIYQHVLNDTQHVQRALAKIQ